MAQIGSMPQDTVTNRLLERDSEKRAMYRSLFVDRGKKPFLCMIPPGGDSRLVDPTRWFYTNADSDLDNHD